MPSNLCIVSGVHADDVAVMLSVVAVFSCLLATILPSVDCNIVDYTSSDRGKGSKLSSCLLFPLIGDFVTAELSVGSWNVQHLKIILSS